MKTKQIVVNKHYESLLTPYWTVEYMKRKGIEVYCYEYIYNDNHDLIGYKLRNPKELNNFYEDYDDVIFIKEYLGDTFSIEKFDNLNKELWFYEYNFENREDKDLIQIAKTINNEKIIKIVEIPSDVEYMIYNYECFGEYVEEKHRTWH